MTRSRPKYLICQTLKELEEIKAEVEKLEKEVTAKNDKKFNVSIDSGIIDISTDLSDEEDEAPREIYLVKGSMKRVLLNRTKTSFGLCIMDSGCEKECAGVQWTEEFIANLSKEDQAKVEKVYDGQKFRFGDGQVMTSLYSVEVPVYIGGIRFYMAWSVMDLDLPLLMSLPVMQRLNIIVKYFRKKDQINDQAWVMGKNIKLHQIDGHQWMTVDYQGSLKDVIQEHQGLQDPEVEAQEVLLSGKIDDKNMKKYIKQLHTNMCHLSGQQMYTILKDCGKWSQSTEAVVEEVPQECENLGCRKKGTIVKNPAANFNMVNAPGELVAVDLKICRGEKPIPYLVDYCTGYCAASLIQDKSAESAAQGVWNAWYKAGLPIIRTLLSDNGGEFTGNAFRKFLERFGTKHLTTAPYNPQSNGKCERIHYVIDSNIAALMTSCPDLKEEDALC